MNLTREKCKETTSKKHTFKIREQVRKKINWNELQVLLYTEMEINLDWQVRQSICRNYKTGTLCKSVRLWGTEVTQIKEVSIPEINGENDADRSLNILTVISHSPDKGRYVFKIMEIDGTGRKVFVNTRSSVGKIRLDKQKRKTEKLLPVRGRQVSRCQQEQCDFLPEECHGSWRRNQRDFGVGLTEGKDLNFYSE